MKKTVNKTTQQEVDEYYCDCCGKEVKVTYHTSNSYTCSICGNIVCRDCSRESPIDNDQTLWTHAYDDPYHICKDCEKIITPYAKKLNNLWIDYLNEKHKTYKQIRYLRKGEKIETGQNMDKVK